MLPYMSSIAHPGPAVWYSGEAFYMWAVILNLEIYTMGFYAEGDLTPNRIELARRRMASGPGYIDLTSSNPTHQGLLFPADVLREATEGYWATRRYDPDPRGAITARQAIARYYAGRSPALDLPVEQIVITASTSEAYSLLFALLAEPGDTILGPNVTYPLFEYLADLHHVELRPYELDESRGWQIDGDSLLAQVDERTRAVLIISPHNPTGMVVGKRVPVLSDLGLPVICDEVFAEFPYRAPAVPPLGALHPELPVFHLNGISKMFALPDLKLGWVALNGPAYERYGARLELLNDTFLSCSSLIQHMLPALFDRGRPFVESMRSLIAANLDLALRLLAECDNIRLHLPDGGYYLFPEVLGWEDEEELVIALLERGVLVHPGYFYGYERGAHLMISCLTERERLAVGLGRLVSALRELY